MADKKTTTNTETPNNSAEAPTSHAQQFPFAGWWQMPAMQWPQMDLPKVPGFQTAGMHKGMEDGMAGLESWLGELDKASREGATKAGAAIEESARLSKAALDYSLELQARANSMWLDGARKAVAAMRPVEQAGA